MRFGKNSPLHEYAASRVAIIKPSALGDIVHSLPVLTALRWRYPKAHITWIINKSYESLLWGHADLDATLPFDRSASRSGWARGLLVNSRFLHDLRQQHFDLVIDLQGLFRSGLMVAACGAQRRVGLSSAREGATWFYSDVIPVADMNTIHAVDRYWMIAEALGAGSCPKTFRLPQSENERQWANEVLRNCPRPWMAFAVGSRWMTKRWPTEYFATLAREAQKHFGGTAIFVGGGEDAFLSRATAAQISGRALDLAGKTTLPQLTALLALADVMIGNDTGPVHLGAALGRPVVAPYTCTTIRRSGPYGAETGAAEAKVWCQGSYIKRCPRLECMSELTPSRLWPGLLEILITWTNHNCSA